MHVKRESTARSQICEAVERLNSAQLEVVYNLKNIRVQKH